MSNHIVIIGNGPAGNRAAATLRENDPDTGITIISDENIEFYYKPRLTQYIAGKISRDKLMVNRFDFYKEKNIRLRLGQRVKSIDPVSQTITLKHMEDIQYDTLIIATGSKARLLPSMEPFADHLNFVSSYNEVFYYKDRIQAATDFFLFGGDLVAFRFLKMLRSMDKNVTMLIYPDAFWPFNLADDMLESITAGLIKTGARILERDSIIDISPKGTAYQVKTRGGVKDTWDMIFSFNGLTPRVEFARGCGLDIDHGILVDETMKTNMDHIYACGSCAQIYNPDINAYTTSIGWPNAAIQGEVAAMNILGADRKVEAAGRKYFDLEGIRIKTAWWEDIDEDLSV